MYSWPCDVNHSLMPSFDISVSFTWSGGIGRERIPGSRLFQADAAPPALHVRPCIGWREPEEDLRDAATEDKWGILPWPYCFKELCVVELMWEILKFSAAVCRHYYIWKNRSDHGTSIRLRMAIRLILYAQCSARMSVRDMDSHEMKTRTQCHVPGYIRSMAVSTTSVVLLPRGIERTHQ